MKQTPTLRLIFQIWFKIVKYKVTEQRFSFIGGSLLCVMRQDITEREFTVCHC